MELEDITYNIRQEESEGYEYEDESLIDSNKSAPHVVGYLRIRAAQELGLLQRQRLMYATCIIVNIYGGSMLFRNIAFYRYVPGERLPQDIGFQIFPHMKGWFTTLPMFMLQTSCLIMCVASFVPRSIPGPFATNIVRRWGVMVAMGSVLRFFTYISTSLPGAADHCVPSKNLNILQDQPKTLSDIFLMFKVDGIGLEGNLSVSGTYNCGDLVFSGHMLMAISYAFTLLRYASAVFAIPHASMFFFRILVWTLVCVQGVTIIMARNHYTMDVVIASYVSPLLWHWYLTALEPEDMKPLDAYVY